MANNFTSLFSRDVISNGNSDIGLKSVSTDFVIGLQQDHIFNHTIFD